jgi:hypothetical protein
LERNRSDAHLLVPAALFWAASLVRVVGALARHEAFGTEATLALMAVLWTPWLFVRRERRTRALGTKGALSS